LRPGLPARQEKNCEPVYVNCGYGSRFNFSSAAMYSIDRCRNLASALAESSSALPAESWQRSDPDFAALNPG
jgi:hypothetical protein